MVEHFLVLLVDKLQNLLDDSSMYGTNDAN